MPKGDAIYNPDVQSDIDMKNTYKLTNWNQGSTSVLSIAQTIYVDGVNGTNAGQRGTTAAFQTLTQALAVAQSGDIIQFRPGSYTTSSSYTISVANLTILGDGVKLLYNNNLGGISIQANGVKIYGLEIDAQINSGTTNNGVIEITGDNCRLERLYIHNSDRIAIRGVSSFNNLSVVGCRLENNNVGIETTVGANVSGVNVQGCLVQNNRQGGIHIRNDNVATYTLTKIRVIGNSLVTNQTGADVENLLLFGGDDDIVVSNNYCSGCAFPISLDHCRRGVCNSNTIKGGTYCGIELAGCQDIVCSSNYVDGRNEAGTSVGGFGIVASNFYASSNDTGPFVISNNLITNLSTNDAINVTAANDVLISGNLSRDNATNKGAFQIKESFRVTVTGNRVVTTFNNTDGPVVLDAGARTVGGKGLQDIELLDNVFDNSGGGKIISIIDTGVKGVNRVKVSGNIVPSGGTFASGYVYDAASTAGLIVEKNIPQATASNNQTGWHNLQQVEQINIPGTGTFSMATPGVTLAYGSGGNYKIGFDDVGATKGYLRYHVDTAGANWGHVFSAGNPAAPTNLLEVLGDGSVKAGSNTVETQNNKGQISGYASLDGTGKVPAAQLPTLSSGTIAVTSSNLKGDGGGNAIAVTATGTGDTVLATSPTLVTPTIGVATATSVNKWTLTAPSTSSTLTAGADNLTYTMPEISTKVGFRHIPQNSQSAPYTTVLNDSGKHIYHPAADANNRTFTIDSNANVAYPIGTAIMFVNLSANNLSIAITADTMYLAGAGTTGTRTLAQYGKATAVKTGTTEWVIAGVGLS